MFAPKSVDSLLPPTEEQLRTEVEAFRASYAAGGGELERSVGVNRDSYAEDDDNCWVNCMKNYQGMGTAISLTTLGTLGNMKIPGTLLRVR